MYQGGQRNDQARGYQVPPPPPMSPPNATNQSANMIIPPPPPRYPNSTQVNGMTIPPPPSGPPPNSTSQNPTWPVYMPQQRPAMAPIQAYNPRLHAPMNSNMSIGNTMGSAVVNINMNPMVNPVAAASGLPGAIPPPPPMSSSSSSPPPDLPMLATYVPGVDTFDNLITTLPPEYYPTPSFTRPPAPPSSAATASSYADENNAPEVVRSRSLSNPTSRVTSTASNGSTLTISLETISYWSMDRVMAWLVANHFSNEWQMTFKHLGLSGLKFLELGSRYTTNIMSSTVYPKLALMCAELDIPWDTSRARDEGKRLRRLIRSIVTGRPVDATKSTGSSSHTRNELQQSHMGTEDESPNTPSNPPGLLSFSNRVGQNRNLPKSIDTDVRRGNPDIVSVPILESPGSNPTSAGALNSTSPHSSSFGHRQRRSVDSVSSNLAIYGSGIPEATRQNLNEVLAAGGVSRRNGQESNRPSPSESEPMSASDKGLRSMFRFGRKKTPREDGEETDSPTSPVHSYKQPSLGSRTHGSDLSLSRPGSYSRLYALVTKDGWSYHMCDLTNFETASELRQIIYNNVGVFSPNASVPIYQTELGRMDHDEPINDAKLLHLKRTKADGAGNLKLLVRVDGGSPGPYHINGLAVDEELYLENNGSKTRTSTLEADSQQYQDEVTRKQREYLAQRQPQFPGIYGRNVDFDKGRPSPYDKPDHEEKKPVPVRNPPALPANPSATLIKVNSLKKKPTHNLRPSYGQLENVAERPGDMANVPHRRAFSSQSPPGTGTISSLINASMGLGGVGSPSGVHHANGSPASPLYESDRPLSQKQHQRSPAPVAPKAPGPDLDFTGNDVVFAAPAPAAPSPADDSDDDSDDGLFAVPIAARKKAAAESASDDARKPNLSVKVPPASDRSKKVRSVTFGSPDSPSEKNSEEFSLFSRGSSSKRTPGTPASDSWDSEDVKLNRRKSFIDKGIWANRPPTDALINHLDDFFPNLDLDAPLVEEGDKGGVMPSPIAEADENSASSASASATSAMAPALPPIVPTAPLALVSDKALKYNESDTLGSNESTLKANQTNRDSLQSVAHRSIGRASGLGRLKSIRQVARDTHEAQKRYTTVSTATPDRATTLQRRKSTKMFGANIVQVRPERDSILYPPIPQDTLPKRQTTFRWFKGQLIGKGSYGRVYLGMNATTGEFLAVKEVDVNPKAAQGDKNKIKEMVAGLDQEIDTMQHLDHINIVQYLGCERKETSISIFLEYIPGGSVGSCLKKHGRFEEPLVSSLTRQTLSGLAYLHREGILHRDLKADNILLDLDGTCKISDFGISKKTDNIYGNDKTNNMQGSVFWMAPEVINPPEGMGYSAKVDIWSLGCVVLEMFAGKRPWGNEEAVGAIYKLANGETPPIPDDISPSPVALAFMLDCFQVSPYDRPTAEKLLAEHPFCENDPSFQFEITDLYAKINPGKVAS